MLLTEPLTPSEGSPRLKLKRPVPPAKSASMSRMTTFKMTAPSAVQNLCRHEDGGAVEASRLPAMRAQRGGDEQRWRGRLGDRRQDRELPFLDKGSLLSSVSSPASRSTTLRQRSPLRRPAMVSPRRYATWSAGPGTRAAFCRSSSPSGRPARLFILSIRTRVCSPPRCALSSTGRRHGSQPKSSAFPAQHAPNDWPLRALRTFQLQPSKGEAEASPRSTRAPSTSLRPGRAHDSRAGSQRE